jgi:hypothetical protein
MIWRQFLWWAILKFESENGSLKKSTTQLIIVLTKSNHFQFGLVFIKKSIQTKIIF